MKKLFILLFSLCLLTGCGTKTSSNEIEGIKLDDKLKTYAIRNVLFQNENGIREYHELVTRYDSNGNLKYFEYTDNYSLNSSEYSSYTDEQLQKMAEEDECKYVQNLNYTDFKSICEVKNRVYKYGYIITDKTIEAGILNDETNDDLLKSLIDGYDSINTEDKMNELINKNLDELKSKKGNVLIVANKKVDLYN